MEDANMFVDVIMLIFGEVNLSVVILISILLAVKINNKNYL